MLRLRRHEHLSLERLKLERQREVNRYAGALARLRIDPDLAADRRVVHRPIIPQKAMRLTDKPHFTPFRCAAVPFIGQTHENTRWIDTGQELGVTGTDHVYLSDHAVREAIKLLGWATPEEHTALQHQTADLASRCAELEEQLTEMEGVVGAIDVIESADFRARRRAGRPKKAKTEAEAA